MNDTAAPPRRLRRSTSDRRVAGVAGGMGTYLGIDPVLVRIAFVVATLAGGAGLVAYVAAWVLMPEDDGTQPTDAPPLLSPASGRVVGAVVLVAAFLIAVDGFGSGGDIFWPLLLVGGGVLLLARPGTLQGLMDRFDTTDHESIDQDGSEERAPGAMPGADPRPADEHHGTSPGGRGGGPGADPPPPGTGTAPVPPAPPVPEGPRVDRVTFAVVLVVAGLLGILAAVGTDVSVRAGLLALLGITTVGLLAGAFVGRARGLLFVAAPLIVALSATSAVDLHLDGGIGDRTYRPTVAEELRDHYELGVGQLTLDLDALPPETWRGRTTEILIEVGLGEIIVDTPDDITVEVRAELDGGDITVFGESVDGTGLDVDDLRRGREGAGILVLVVDVGLGQLTVR